MAYSDMIEKLVKLREMIRAQWELRRCDSVGSRTRVQGRMIIRRQGEIHVGSQTFFLSEMMPIELITLPGGKLEIGDKVGINYGTSITAQSLVTIGTNCRIGQCCLIMDTDWHTLDDYDKRPPGDPIVLEENVWLAAHVTILKGVTIGRNAIVSAGSVVTSNVRPYTMVAGVPARLIKHLDEPELICK